MLTVSPNLYLNNVCNGLTRLARNSGLSGAFQGVASASALFVTSLFDPFLNPPEATRKAFRRLQEEGVTGVVIRVAHAVKTLPFETCMTAGSLALIHTDVANVSSLFPVALATAAAVRQGQTLVKLGQSIQADAWAQKGLKIAFYGTAIYLVCSIPAAAAAKHWVNLAEAKEYYSGGPCQGKIQDTISPADRCLQLGQNVDECGARLPAGADRDLYVFTHHPSGAVSVVQVDEGVCFLTALSRTDAVTRTCFAKLSNPSSRTVELVADMSLARAHEGLPMGRAVHHIGLRLDNRECGSFYERSAQVNFGDQPTCLLTALKPDGPVSQTCFDPQNPTLVTLKEVEGIALDFHDDGKPVSIVIKNPKLLGLDPYPSPESDPTCTCECPAP